MRDQVDKQMIGSKSEGINWPVVLFMAAFHLAAIPAFWMFSWSALGVAVLVCWMAGGLGIGMGYHRLLTHRGYRVPKPIEYFLTLCGTFALQGGPIAWVATHRVHHVFSDREGDPHSPRDGVWWSHMGWMLQGQSLHSDTKITARHAADLAKDRFYVWLTHWHFLTQVPLAAILYLLGGWPFVFWGIFVRTVFLWHATWFVNSAAHLWGGRRFETRDDSRNNWWVALVTFGEGWHNNHHAHPASARHGLAWYEFDVNWYGIRTLQLLGLAKAIRLAKLPKTKSSAGKSQEQLADAA